VKPGRNIRVIRFGVGNLSSVNGKTGSSVDGGPDAKIGIGTNLVFDATWRTDFFEVEVDTQPVNLTRFSLFFPEKREFFLENQGNFLVAGFTNTSNNFIPHPLSDLHVVYNDTRGVSGFALPPARSLTVKMTQLFSF
jgi:hypothetical protein